MHPTQNLLSDYVLGKLVDLEFDDIADHVESCRTCQSIIQDLESEENDELVDQLRTPNVRVEAYGAEQPFQEAMATVMEYGKDALSDEASIETEGDNSSVEADHLRDYRLLEKIGEGGRCAMDRHLPPADLSALTPTSKIQFDFG